MEPNNTRRSLNHTITIVFSTYLSLTFFFLYFFSIQFCDTRFFHCTTILLLSRIISFLCIFCLLFNYFRARRATITVIPFAGADNRRLSSPRRVNTDIVIDVWHFFCFFLLLFVFRAFSILDRVSLKIHTISALGEDRLFFF